MSNPRPLPAPAEWACLQVGRDLAEVGPATDALRAWLVARGATDETTLDEISLVVAEALTNAARHGGDGTEGFSVRFAWCLQGENLEIEISEPGTYSPAAHWDQLPADPLSEGGRGGFLITRLMDVVEHANTGGRHHLRLRRRLALAAPSPSPGSAAVSAAALAETEAALVAMTEELGNAYETIAALFGLAEGLATTPTLAALAGASLARLRPLLGADAAWVRLLDADGGLVRLAADGPAPGPARLGLAGPVIEGDVARGGLERTLEHRSALAPEDPLHASAGAAFVCPFSFEGRLRGVLTVTRDADAPGFFSAGQTALARTVADFLGIACANADLQSQRQARESARRELEIAAQIQRALLPGVIAPHPAWSVAGVCAQAAEVGGDFYDVLDLPDGARLIVIADVMGKGVPAALVAATLRTAVRALATVDVGPGELLTRINRQLHPDLERLGLFITAQVLRLEADGLGLRCANAGHCPLLTLDHAGAPHWWDEDGGLPLGVLGDEIYAEARTVLPPGGRAWLMTDGALEHEDAAGEELGADALARLAAAARDPEALHAALHLRAAGRPVRDDCTLVRIARHDSLPARP